MYRLLLVALALPFAGSLEPSVASSTEANVEVVAVDLSGRQTNHTSNPTVDTAPTVARDGRVAFVITVGPA